ncbi:lysylphosphatidylglycerol synthase transmembrane domain-containing protein [Thermosipho africanus]|uniref:lysylphosphatidylglycerol synthase transmembrane domain-containing protein n=1 Tax=Thermosipho africanus TaxID=2421 RepID=UPI0014750C2F|nr:lysylphosphatidylglycerol synthase transmembrane domain-containing protein [Thermosipho africanus]
MKLSEANRSKKSIFKKVFISLIISFSMIILFQFFYSTQVSFLRDLLTIEFLISLLILVIIYLIDTMRLSMLLKFFKYNLPFKETFKNIFFGKFISYITPMSIGGQPYQIYHLSKIGVKTEDATNIVISRTLEMSFVVLIIDILSIRPILSAYPKSFGLSLILTGFIVSFSISLLILIGFINKKFLEKILSFFGKFSREKLEREKIIEWIDSLHESIKILWIKNPWVLILDIILYFVTILLYTYIFYIFVDKFSGIEYLYLLGIISLLNSVAYYIPTPGSSGGIEGTYQIVFSQILGPDVSIRIITVYRVVTFYIPLLLGSVFITKISTSERI